MDRIQNLFSTYGSKNSPENVNQHLLQDVFTSVRLFTAIETQWFLTILNLMPTLSSMKFKGLVIVWFLVQVIISKKLLIHQSKKVWLVGSFLKISNADHPLVLYTSTPEKGLERSFLLA